MSTKPGEPQFDAEFFKKEYLSLPYFPHKVGDIAIVRSGTTPSDRDDELRNGVILLKTTDIRNRPLNTTDSSSFYRISPETAERMRKTKLQPGDVLINIVGATNEVVGRVAIVPSNFPEANITQAMAMIRSQNSAVSPELIFAFLASKYGAAQIRRLARPTGQFNLNIPEVESLSIPDISSTLRGAIKKCIDGSLLFRDAAQMALTNAEAALLSALGLEEWQPPERLSYCLNSRAVFAAERLDAEHFQPKFASLIEHLEKAGQAEYLGSLLGTNQRGKQPIYSEVGLPVVNSKHVLKGEVRLDSDNRNAVFDDNSFLIESGDVLLNGTGVGTIGRSAPYLHKSKAVPDNHVTVLRPKAGIDSIYLSVFLNSLAGQLQVEERLRGSSGQIELYPNDIAKFKVWVAPEPIQKGVRKSVLESFQRKLRATQLLNAAKRGVEIAIEQDEKSALAYLDAYL